MSYHEQLKGLESSIKALSKGLEYAYSALEISKEAIESNPNNDQIANDAVIQMDAILAKAKQGLNVDSEISEYVNKIKTKK
jgi:hypothetical protein